MYKGVDAINFYTSTACNSITVLHKFTALINRAIPIWVSSFVRIGMATTDHTRVSAIATADLPVPVLFHPLKHHLGFIKAFIKEQTRSMSTSAGTLLLSIGSSQLDFYTGTLTPQQIAREVILYLALHNLLHPELYHSYLTATGSHYQTITLSDTTDWVLR